MLPYYFGCFKLFSIESTKCGVDDEQCEVEVSCQEAGATSSLSRRKESWVTAFWDSRQMIIRPRMSLVFTLPVLMRKHGFFGSQSSHCLPVLQRWWKHLELQQFHFLAGGFNIQPPSLNNKPETVSTSEANLIEKHAALAAILLHHADTLPRLEAVNVIHSVLLRSRSTVCWWEERRGGASVFHHIPIHHNVTQLPACQDSQCGLPGVRVRIFRVLNQEMITTSHDSWWGLDVILYSTCWAPEAPS